MLVVCKSYEFLFNVHLIYISGSCTFLKSLLDTKMVVVSSGALSRLIVPNDLLEIV